MHRRGILIFGIDNELLDPAVINRDGSRLDQEFK